MTSSNRDQNKPEKENMRLELWLWTVMCVCAIIVMQLFAANKTVAVADTRPDPSMDESDALKGGEAVRRSPLLLERNPGQEKSFSIPLPKGTKAEDVVMENRYDDCELWMYIKCGDAAFFEESTLTGDIGEILSGTCEIRKDGVLLQLKMRRIMEYKSAIDGNGLLVACYEPGELYEYIVVLDPAGGGDTGLVEEGIQEKDVALSVAGRVQKKLSQTNVRVYLTRTGDTELSAESRLELIEQLDADIYLGIGVSKSEENPDRYGIMCYYNEDYFLPYFGNVQLADIVTREVTVASSNRAAGPETAGAGSLLRRIEVPAAQLSLGFLSNSEERALLGQESYQEKLAEGVAAAIEQACQERKRLGGAGIPDGGRR